MRRPQSGVLTQISRVESALQCYHTGKAVVKKMTQLFRLTAAGRAWYTGRMKKKNLIFLHLSVFLFGSAGLFGKLIDLSPVVITQLRTLLSSVFLLCVLLVTKQSLKLERRRDFFSFLALGVLLAVHWWSFFYSIQLTSVAVALLTCSTFPVFITFIEPIVFREKLKGRDVLLALVTFLGIFIIVPPASAQGDLLKGALMGILAGFSYAVLTVCNRGLIRRYSAVKVSFYEQAVVAVVLLPFLLSGLGQINMQKLALAVVMGVVFTALSHTLFINSLHSVRAQTASIIACFEPVYGILLAWLILSEMPTLRQVIGGVVILGGVACATVIAQKGKGGKGKVEGGGRM